MEVKRGVFHIELVTWQEITNNLYVSTPIFVVNKTPCGGRKINNKFRQWPLICINTMRDGLVEETIDCINF